MNTTKSITTAALASGLVLVGAGVAFAGGNSERATDADQTDNNVEGVSLQVDGEETDGERSRKGRSGRKGQKLATIAEVIGVEVDDLKAELEDGSTLAEVAEANGVAVDTVVDALIANVTEKLDEKVEAGDLTSEEAAEKLEAKTEKITNKVNGIENEDSDRRSRGNGGAGEQEEAEDTSDSTEDADIAVDSAATEGDA